MKLSDCELGSSEPSCVGKSFYDSCCVFRAQKIEVSSLGGSQFVRIDDRLQSQKALLGLDAYLTK